MATVVMSITGVLSVEGAENLFHCESSLSGRVFYDMIRDTSRVVLLSNDPSKDRAKAWLARERITRYADVHCYRPESLLTPTEWRIQHLRDLIGVGHHISFYIDSDPRAIGMALEAGVGTLLVTSAVGTPGFGAEELKYSPWYDLVDVIERKSLARASSAAEDDDG